MDFSESYRDTVSSVAAAARSGRRRRVRRLIRGGCSPDCRDNRGWSALHEAAAAGHAPCVREILSAVGAGSSRRARAYVNALTHEGESACHLAAGRGHLPALRLLLRAGADIDQPTNDLSCPLYAAVDGGHEDVVRVLLRKGAAADGTHTASCWTCLHQAVYQGHVGIVRALVDVSDLEARDDHDITPLFVAAQYGREACLQTLLQAGANVNAPAADLATPLLIAAQEGHGGCVDLLLQHGADANMACSREWPQLPVHAAAQFGHTRVLRRLMDVTDRRCGHAADMVSPLYAAVLGRRRDSVATLLRGGYGADAQDCSRSLGLRSPLSLALLEEPCRAVVAMLLAAGASLSEDDWLQVFAADTAALLQLVVQQRRFRRPDGSARGSAAPPGGAALTPQQLTEMLGVALSRVESACCWLPVLLRTGLDPALLLQNHMLEEADGEALNYLLDFVNWSTLSAALRRVLDQRRADKTWEPRPHLESMPRLSHLCRLRVREVLGPELLMRTRVVRQLPVPPPLHRFLTFRDVKEPAHVHPAHVHPPPS